MQQVLRNMLGRPKLQEVHRELLQALQGPDGPSLPELLVMVVQMGLVKDEDQAQEVKLARQQLEQAAEVNPAHWSGAKRVLTIAGISRAAGAGGGGDRGCMHTSLRCSNRMRQGVRTLL